MFSLEKLLHKSPSLRLSRPFALVLELAHVLFPVESFYLFVLELLEFRGTMERAKATILKKFSVLVISFLRGLLESALFPVGVCISLEAPRPIVNAPNHRTAAGLAPLGSKRTCPAEIYLRFCL